MSLDDYTKRNRIWQSYKRKYDENVCIVLNIRDCKLKFLTYISDECFNVYENLIVPRRAPFEEALGILDEHFKSRSKISFKIHTFHNIKQHRDEKISDFYIRLKHEASKCEFTNMVNKIKQQIILTTNTSKVRRYSLINYSLLLHDLLIYRKTLEETEA